MLTANVVAVVLGAAFCSALVRTTFPRAGASFGAVLIASIAGGLVMYAACMNVGLPSVYSVEIGGNVVFVFWILAGNLWSALVVSFIAGPRTDKSSGVR